MNEMPPPRRIGRSVGAVPLHFALAGCGDCKTSDFGLPLYMLGVSLQPVHRSKRVVNRVHDQWSSLRGDQPHSGQRMLGPDGSCVFSSCWRSACKTTEDCAEFPARAHMCQYYGQICFFGIFRSSAIAKYSN
jgi:hypothetical protein